MLKNAIIICSALLMSGFTTRIEQPTRVSDFSLEDYNGIKHSLSDYRDSKAIVLMFIATQCPVSNAYNERMVKLDEDYAAKGIAFVGINANRQEGIQEIARHAKEHGFGFPVLRDVDNRVADAYDAQVTPEIFVIDSLGTLRYHGRIDDSRDIGGVHTQDLRLALDALLGGKDVPRAETKAFGCSIKRVKSSS